ncbi:MAG TPA: amidohydrolase family protein [Candidatus Acidoferrales bacterium]|jgi:predicted TIM-barrel fold metal-dependent hydrolase|nr:amidohydrolase family protein [Candidatus Acidoferrales bacterium]
MSVREMDGKSYRVNPSPFSRRDLLWGLAALGASAAVPEFIAGAQMGSSVAPRPFRIDTHHHFTVPKLLAESAAKGVSQPGLQDWTPQKSLDQMDKGGVGTSIISISDPGVWFGDNTAARALARECNEYAAKLIKDYPGRFGLFATLPLPDVEGALLELEYAMDTLKADGACVLSSYGGKYLGNPSFAPLMAELNRRKTVVFCHPYCAACGTQAVLSDGQNRGVEFVFDTTRTIVSLLSTGTVTRCPDIRFIWSHGGGTVPYITSRLNGVAPQLPKGVIYELQKFYYDTAQAFNPYTLPSFKKLVPASHILFGTDFPLGGGSGAAVSKGLMENGGFSEEELHAIDRQNALELLPRLKT